MQSAKKKVLNNTATAPGLMKTTHTFIEAHFKFFFFLNPIKSGLI